MKKILLLSISLCAFSAFASGPDMVTGAPRVIDGDSLEINDHNIRLYGIDAPEMKQMCHNEGRSWGCGLRARNVLREIIADDEVTCLRKDTDRYGRMVGFCYIDTEEGQIDLSKAMVTQGYALAYRTYNVKFITDELIAKYTETGMWDSKVTPPWEWRKEN